MLKLKVNALSLVENLYYLDGHRFNGIAVQQSGESISGILNILDGSPTSESIARLLPSPPDGDWIVRDSLVSKYNDDSEPFLYNDILFTGIAFDFSGSFLDTLTYLIDGNVVAEASWLKNGNTATEQVNNEHVYEDYWWHANQQPKNVDIYIKPNDRFRFHCNEDGELTALAIDGNFSKSAVKFENLFLHPEFSDINAVLQKKWAQCVSISGKGITPDIFSTAIENLHKNNTKILRIRETQLPESSLENIAMIHSLRELTISNDHQNSEQLENKLKLKLKNCETKFD